MVGKNSDLKGCNLPGDVIDLDLWSSPGTPLSPIICVKTIDKMRELEKKEDCFILDFDPECPSVISKLSEKFDNIDAPDISVIAEKGQVACRDYPHPRHLCLKYPFETTSHEKHCELCFCFVCDLAAPCKNWTGSSGHCNAINNEAWGCMRKTYIKSVIRD